MATIIIITITIIMVQVVVNGPADAPKAAFFFLEEILGIIDQVLELIIITFIIISIYLSIIIITINIIKCVINIIVVSIILIITVITSNDIQVLVEMSPGLPIDKHILSPTFLEQGTGFKKCYSPR